MPVMVAGCKQNPELPAIISPYRIDIQQGNVVTQEMLAKLKAGMTRSQVRFALGSPLVVDAFRTDRWDYVYSMQRQGKVTEHRRVTVIFDEDKLIRIEGDVLAVDSTLISDRPLPRAISAPAVTAEKPAVPKPEPAKPAEQPAAKPPLAAAPAVDKPAAVVKPAAPKPEPAKPAEQPATQAPLAAAPAVDKPAAPKPEPAKPAEKAAATVVPAAKREVAADKIATPGTAQVTTAAAAAAAVAADARPEAANADNAKSAPAAAKNTDTAKTDSGKEKPKTGGIFGRMLDKIGF